MAERDTPINILLVEDNDYDAKIVANLFNGMKAGVFSLRTADTLEKARLADAAESADVVLLDLNLPDSYGPDTLVKSKELFADRPIIVMTGFYEEPLGVQLIQKGAQDYVVKGKITGDWLSYSIKYAIERAKIELKMREREASLRDMLEKIPEGFLSVREDGRVLFANRGAERIFGQERTELISRPFMLESEIGAALETDLRSKDGRKVPIEVRAAEIQWGAEKCRLVMVRDLTQAKQLERARNDFISMVSHELRSPLTVVKEALDLVYDGTVGEVSDRQKEILKMGLDNTRRLNRLIDGLLDITKIEAGVMPMNMAETDFGALLSATAGDYSFLASERGIALKTELPEQRLSGFCDRDKLREVLVNLASNAIKFTPRGGSIVFSLRPWEGQALFCVENTGRGIEPEDLPKLFSKFSRVGSTAEPGVEGTGLGLAISRGIVEMHSGHIWAESDPGKNCKFFVLLPLPVFRDAVRQLLRREIDSSAGGKRPLAALLLALPGGENSDMAERAAELIRSTIRSANVLVRDKDGYLLALLSNSGIKECAKTMASIQKSLAELTGGESENTRITSLIYPEDFSDEETFFIKMSVSRGG